MAENYTDILSVMLSNKCLGYENQQNNCRALSLHNFHFPFTIYSSGLNINYQGINLGELITNHNSEIDDMIKVNKGNYHISKYLRYHNE